MILHGFTIVTMFGRPCSTNAVHKTAFASPKLNEAFGWLAGLFSLFTTSRITGTTIRGIIGLRRIPNVILNS